MCTGLAVLKPSESSRSGRAGAVSRLGGGRMQHLKLVYLVTPRKTFGGAELRRIYKMQLGSVAILLSFCACSAAVSISQTTGCPCL